MENKVEIHITAKDLASRVIRNLNTTVTGVTGKLGDMAKTIGGKVTEGFAQMKYAAIGAGVAIAAVGVNMAKAAIASAASTEELRMSLDVLTGSADKGREVFKKLYDFAARTPFETAELAKATQTMLGFGISPEKVMDNLRMLGDISMGSKDKLQGLSLAFSQVQSTGRLMGQDLLQMINQGFNPLTIIAKQTGKSVKVLKEEMEQGAISADMVTQAMVIATSKGGLFFEGMDKGANTLNGLWSTLKDSVGGLARQLVGLNEAGEIVEGGMMSKLKTSISTLTVFIDNNKDSIINFVNEGLEKLRAKIVELDQQFGIKDKLQMLMEFIVNNKENLVTFAKNFGMVTVAVIALGIAVGLLTSPLLIALAAIGLVSAAMTIWQNDIWNVKTKTEEAINKVREVFTALMQNPSVQWFINKVEELSGQIRDNLVKVVESLRASFEKLSPKINELVRNIAPLAAAIGGALILHIMTLTEYFTRILPPAISVITWLLGGILSMVNSNINSFKTWYGIIKSVIDKLKEVHTAVSNATVGKLLGVNKNAAGTSFYGGGATMVGERGPELVQLPRGSKINSASETRNASTSTPITNNITINGYDKNPRELAQMVADYIARSNKLSTYNMGF